MAHGARNALGVDFALATTGIAGPDGGSAEKPVGLVWFALVDDTGNVSTHRGTFPGQRPDVLNRATMTALSLIWRRLEQAPRESAVPDMLARSGKPGRRPSR